MYPTLKVIDGFDFKLLGSLGYTYLVKEAGYVSPDGATLVIDNRSGHKNEVLQTRADEKTKHMKNVEKLSEFGFLCRPLVLSFRTDFAINMYNMSDALKALQNAARVNESFPYRDAILSGSTLQDALKNKMEFNETFFALHPKITENRNLELNDKPIFDVLVPFVNMLCFIEFWLEATHLRRWVFDGETCQTLYCKMEWTDPEEDSLWS